MIRPETTLARSASTHKPSVQAPAAPLEQPKAKAQAPVEKHTPGEDAKVDFEDYAAPGKQKMSTGDKIQMASSLAMGGAMVFPMIEPMLHKDDKSKDGAAGKPTSHYESVLN